ncbi:MAG: HlyC/CorC family transporter [Ruminococcaceae bacterium]|nr:HlyC/CorC family transporter [Oscillospiraceae bacterium]
METILPYTIVMILLVFMSAYFSATETAFSSLNKTRLKALAEEDNKKAKLALKLAEEYDKLISTILIGNNIVNIALASIATVMFMKINEQHGATISTVVVTVVVLIFGEISPKSIAKDSPEQFAMFSSKIIRGLIFLLTPVNFLFTLWKKLLSRIFKIENNSKMSQEELLMLVEEIEQDGSVDSDDGELIRNAIEFSDMEAEDILTHRVDIEAVSIEDSKEEIADTFIKTRFSRLLVYDGSIDNIIGVIHLKDFFTANGVTKKNLKDIMTKPVFIQKSEKIDDILKILQTNKSHIAIVVDEYGGTFGMVTMEDILEELVGEIWDEHDEVVEDFKKIDEHVYRVEGSVNFDDLCDFFGIKFETDRVSVGGWVMEQLGKMPEKGDKFDFEHLSITITGIDSHRVTEIIIKEGEKAEEEE